MGRQAFFLLTLLLLGATAAPAQKAASQDPLAAMEAEIIVEGQRLDQERAEQFVEEALPDAGDRQLPRWHVALCPALIGFTADQAGWIRQTILKRAAALGLPAPSTACRPNIAILLTNDPDGLIDALIAKYPRLFRPDREQTARTILSTPRDEAQTIRAWYHVQDRTTSGREFGLNDEGLLINRVFTHSRAAMTAIATLQRAILIVDVRQIGGYRLDAIADHLAMLSLGRFGSDIGAGIPTILNLFNGAPTRPDKPAGFTDWDLSLLDGLYLARTDAKANQQQARIVRHITEEPEER